MPNFTKLESLIKKIAQTRVFFHGTGAESKFKRFDNAFLGKGEGAQAFGTGHYVTKSKALANRYAEANTSKLRAKLNLPEAKNIKLRVKERGPNKIAPKGITTHKAIVGIERAWANYPFVRNAEGAEAAKKSLLDAYAEASDKIIPWVRQGFMSEAQLSRLDKAYARIHDMKATDIPNPWKEFAKTTSNKDKMIAKAERLNAEKAKVEVPYKSATVPTVATLEIPVDEMNILDLRRIVTKDVKAKLDNALDEAMQIARSRGKYTEEQLQDIFRRFHSTTGKNTVENYIHTFRQLTGYHGDRQLMMNQGFDGIRFAGAGGKASYDNYVIFDPGKISILNWESKTLAGGSTRVYVDETSSSRNVRNMKVFRQNIADITEKEAITGREKYGEVATDQLEGWTKKDQATLNMLLGNDQVVGAIRAGKSKRIFAYVSDEATAERLTKEAAEVMPKGSAAYLKRRIKNEERWLENVKKNGAANDDFFIQRWEAKIAKLKEQLQPNAISYKTPTDALNTAKTKMGWTPRRLKSIALAGSAGLGAASLLSDVGEANAMPLGVIEKASTQLSGPASRTAKELVGTVLPTVGKKIKQVIKGTGKNSQWRDLIFEDGTHMTVTSDQASQLTRAAGTARKLSEFNSLGDSDLEFQQAMRSLVYHEDRAQSPLMTKGLTQAYTKNYLKTAGTVGTAPETVFVKRNKKYFSMPKQYAEVLEKQGVLRIDRSKTAAQSLGGK